MVFKMRVRFLAAVGLVLHTLRVAAFAVTLSGVMIYSTDHYGNPNAWNAQKDYFAHGQLWRTLLGGDWYGLGLLAGLPPANSDAPVLNAPNFAIQLPLAEGENDFTLVGEPSVLTRQDDFSHFALNLYFDGVVDRPGISVLFPRYSPRGGSPPLPNVAPVMYALSLAGVTAPADSTYTDGVDRVSVMAVSFLPPEKFGADYDKVSAQAVLPSSASPGPNGTGADGLGGFDYVGVLKINVEGLGAASAPAAPVVPRALVVMPGVVVGPSIEQAATGGAAPVFEQPSGGDGAALGSVGGTPVHEGEATPLVAHTSTPAAAGAKAETTRTPVPTLQVTATAVNGQVTPTPALTRGSEPPPPSGTPAVQSASPAGAEGRSKPTVAPTGRSSG
jgi:hypothetical protein